MNYEELEKKRVGRRIASARVKKGMTQAELAWDVNCTQEEISSYENGRRMPSEPTLNMLAKRLGFTAKWLRFGDTDSMIMKQEAYGRSIVYRHIESSEPINDNVDLDSLNDEDRVIAKNIIHLLSLDEHPDELKKIIDAEDAEFKAKMAQSRMRKTKPDSMAAEITKFLRDFYPPLYQEVAHGHKLITDAVIEAVNSAIETYPDLADAVQDLNLAPGSTPEEQDENREKLVDSIFPMIKQRVMADRRAERMSVKKARGKNVL